MARAVAKASGLVIRLARSAQMWCRPPGLGPQARTTESAIETIVAGLQRVAVELSRDFSPEA